ncbi:MAG: hypothetical protein DSY42_02835 [Aquifex sp.]|nr:MAG: hypothetical protein DSY42_02835 [Aquifex sp.]
MLPDINYKILWFFASIFTLVVSTNFRIIGDIVVNSDLRIDEVFKLFFVSLVRFIALSIPIFLWIISFSSDINLLLYLLIFSIPIEGLISLAINAVFFKSFVFLILSFTDIGLLWSCFVYIILIENGLKLKNACTFLTGLIIIIPLFAQVAYFVADGISKYADKTGSSPQSAMAAVIGLTVCFFVYIANGVVFMLYPTFKLCVNE